MDDIMKRVAKAIEVGINESDDFVYISIANQLVFMPKANTEKIRFFEIREIV